MAQRQHFRIPEFSGGYNPDQSPTVINDNQAQSILNFRLDKIGTLVSRNGFDDYVTDSTLDASTLRGIGRWRDPDDPATYKVLLAANNNLYHVDAGGNTYTSLYSGLTDTDGDFTNVRDIVIFTNGTDNPVRYDGTNAYQLGIEAPTSAPTVSSAGAGSLTGDYSYVYTYYDSATGVESNPSDADTITASSENVDVAFAASPNSRVDKVRIYRTTDGGATHLLLATVDDTSSPYTDSSSADGSVAAPSTNDEAPVARYAAYYAGYTFLAQDRTLYWSKALSPDHWPVLNSTEVPFEGNDRITGLHAFQDALLIFGLRNTLLLTGGGGVWSVTRLDADIGAVGQRAIVEVAGQVIFLSMDGLYAFPGMTPIAPQLARLLAGLSYDTLQDAAGVYVPEERALWMTVDDITYTVHLPNQAVSRYSIYSRAWLPGGPDGFSLPLFMRPDTGRVAEYGGALDDNGTDISVSWKSKIFQLQNPEHVKHFRRLGAFATQGASGAVTVTISDAGSSYTLPITSTSDEDGGEYGTAIYDTDTYAFEGVSYFIGSLPAATLLGRTFEVSLTADVSEPIEILPPLTFEYRESGRFM